MFVSFPIGNQFLVESNSISFSNENHIPSKFLPPFTKFDNASNWSAFVILYGLFSVPFPAVDSIPYNVPAFPPLPVFK